MTERVQSLVGKLNECVHKESDEEISKHLHDMLEAFRNVPLSKDAEWRREIDAAATKEISLVTHLVEEVEDIVDLLSFSKNKGLRRANSRNKMNEISSKIRQFLSKDRDYPSSYGLIPLIQDWILFSRDIMGSSNQLQFLDLLKKFSDKVCNDLKNLKWQKPEFVSESYHQNDVEIIEVSLLSNQSAMAQRTQDLGRKLISIIPKVSDEKISEDLLAIKEALERSDPHLCVVEWRREFDSAAAKRISHATELVDEIEDFVDNYSWVLSGDGELSEIAKIIYQFLVKDRNPSSSEIPTQFPELVRSFSGEVCNRLENLDHSTPKLTCLVGRQKDIISFHASLSGKESECASLVSVAVTGICGIGKTCLAEAMFMQVKNKFNCYAWINTHRKSTLEILQQMWMAFSKSQSVSPPRNGSLMDEDEVSLSHRVQSYLIKKQFLLVLDDISSVSVWKSVKEALPKNNTRGKIILTSRTSEFPGCIHIKLKPLESKDALDLLSEHAKHSFSGISSECKPIVETISMLCCGNPLVIKIVGGMLNSMMPTDYSRLREGHKRMEEVSHAKRERGEQNNFIPLCYAALPPVLKSCFLYAALFPPQSQINCKKLMRLWIAEGFLDEKDKSMTKEEIAEQQLHELLQRNLFQVTKLGRNGKPILCQLLRPLQEFAIKRSQEDGFSVTSETGSSLPVERPLRLSLIARHSQSNMNIDKTTQSRLRSLLVLQGSKLQTSFIKRDLFSSFILLRVLELQDMPIKALPDSLGKLFLMRYLGLRGTKLIELPKSLDKLIDLQTLDIRNTMVRSLPENLEHLTELRHLLLAPSFDDKAVNFPVVIADFKQLQTLAGVKLTESIAKDLVEIPQLQKLSVGKVKSDLLELLAKSINQMICLQSLSINCDLGEKIHTKFFEPSSTTKIEKLGVRGKVLHLLNWVKSLKSLRSLHLWDCMLTEDLFLEIGNLPKLEFLSVRKAYIGHRIEFHSGAFPNLKKLSILHFQAFSEWHIGGGAVENLEKLTIEGCSKLTNLPLCFRNLANFRLMQVRKMPEAFTEEARKLAEGASFSLVVQA